MKVWITKYALTKGLYELEVEQSVNYPSHVFQGLQNFHDKEWYETKLEAIDKANDMKDTKLKSLRKSIKKLESMEFK